ncbi:MAG: type II secretion system protein M [Sandaracinaceae bacterium]|nr:type II secretion system protein M [Sandaracinaceae bacterium]
MDRIRALFAGLGAYWTNLTDRERLLLGILGAVAGALVVLLPVYLLSTSIRDLERDNEEITTALRTISRSRSLLAAQRAERAAADQRYARQAPSLGSFLEAKAGEQQGLAISDVQHEPDREVNGYRLRLTRARFQGTGLRPAIRLLASIKNSRYPVAIERIHVDHQLAGDRYNFQIGIVAFDRPEAQAATGADAGVPSSAGPGRAGPAAP